MKPGFYTRRTRGRTLSPLCDCLTCLTLKLSIKGQEKSARANLLQDCGARSGWLRLCLTCKGETSMPFRDPTSRVGPARRWRRPCILLFCCLKFCERGTGQVVRRTGTLTSFSRSP